MSAFDKLCAWWGAVTSPLITIYLFHTQHPWLGTVTAIFALGWIRTLVRGYSGMTRAMRLRRMMPLGLGPLGGERARRDSLTG